MRVLVRFALARPLLTEALGPPDSVATKLGKTWQQWQQRQFVASMCASDSDARTSVSLCRHVALHV